MIARTASLPRIAALFAASILSAFLASHAHAQASRTWVSGVGDDANPCSRTAPCKTFAGAISKTAAGGEISVLDPGGFGALTITKSITLNGEGTLASILVSGTNGINVSAGATDTVIIRNISINGIGTGINGINFLSGGSLHVDNVSILGFTGQGIAFQPSGTSSLFVSNSTMRNSHGAVLVQPGASGTANAVLSGVVAAGNFQGLRASDGSNVNIRDSSFVGSSGSGIIAQGSTRAVDVSIESTVVSSNGSAGIFSGTLATVRIANVMSTRNLIGLQNSGGSIVSFGNNRVLGNISSDGAPTSTPGQI